MYSQSSITHSSWLLTVHGKPPQYSVSQGFLWHSDSQPHQPHWLSHHWLNVGVYNWILNMEIHMSLYWWKKKTEICIQHQHHPAQDSWRNLNGTGGKKTPVNFPVRLASPTQNNPIWNPSWLPILGFCWYSLIIKAVSGVLAIGGGAKEIAGISMAKSQPSEDTIGRWENHGMNSG